MKQLLAIATLSLLALAITGCDPTTANRDVKPEEVQDAKARRIAEIDKLNIPQEQKDRMKAQIQGNSQPQQESTR